MLVIKAIQFAAKAHEGQTRKGTGLPYVTHPIIASYLLVKYKESKHIDQLMAAAILHDTLEDTDTNFIELATEFTPMVAGLVLELTSDKKEIERVGKNNYMKKKLLGMSSYALVIKLVDRLSNIMDAPTDKMRSDTRELLEFIEVNRKLSETQKRIVSDIRDHLGVKHG